MEYAPAARQEGGDHDANLQPLLAGGITVFLENGGAIEMAQHMAGHANPRAQVVNFMTVADFPSLAASALRTIVLARYALPTTLRRIATRRDLPDFSTVNVARLARPSLSAVLEAAAIKSAASTLVERGETGVRLRTYGYVVPVTRHALVNDQDAAIAEAIRDGVTSALQVEDNRIFEALASSDGFGQTMADGARLFAASHGNVGTGVIGTAALTEAFGDIGAQLDANGVHHVDAPPRFLVCAPSLVVTALAALVPLGASPVLEVIGEPRLGTASYWFVIADPAKVPALYYGGLAGDAAPRVRLMPSSGIDGLAFKVLHDTEAWASDWRPLWRSTGT